VTNVLALIPARGGSKGVPGKNLMLVGGKSLLARSIEVAMESTFVTRTVVSTEDDEIAAIAKTLGAEVPRMRPVSLAGDDTLMLPVLQHEVISLEQDGFHSDVVVLLQPTSPLRKVNHIDDAVSLLLESGADSVVTVCVVPHNFHPISIMKLDNGLLKPYLEGEGTRVLDRHGKPPVYARCGPSVVATKYTTIMGKDQLYGDECRPLVVPWELSIDIDSLSDVFLAETLLASGIGESD